MNVSRDAMAAYVECQIMKRIYVGLSAAGFSCSWQDIFHYRERHVGGATQCIKEIAYRLHEKQLRKEQQQQQQLAYSTENTYSNVQPEPKPAPPSACALHGHGNSNAGNCALHHPAPPTNLNCMYQQQQQQQQGVGALMTHSRSLEHYQEPHAILPHRHSFDQHPKDCAALHAPHGGHMYEAPYDCLDGLSMGSSVSYAAVAGGYNAPGNRYPLPYNISSQLNAQYATPHDGYSKAELNNVNMYASIGKPPSTVPHSCGYHGGGMVAPPPSSSRQAATASAMAAMQHRQSTYPPDHHLIDFDDRAQLMQHDYNDPRLYDTGRRGQPSMRSIGSRQQQLKHSSVYAQAGYAGDDYDTSLSNLPTTLPQPSAQDMYIYAQPVPKSSRIRAQLEAAENAATTDRQQRHREMVSVVKFLNKLHSQPYNPQDPIDNNRKTMHKELRERSNHAVTDMTDARHQNHHHPQHRQARERDIIISDETSYESQPSLDDFTMPSSASPPLMPKVQEGVGSFESWNYVFKNLERSGYSKDLGDREDLLVQSLDLDSMTLANGGMTQQAPAEKRRTETHSQSANVEKSRTLEKKREPREARVVQAPPPAQLPNSSSAGVKKVKSALKTATIDNRATGSGSGNTGQRGRNNTSSSTGAVAKQPPPVSTQLIVTSPNEWSCRFCTFLNPDTKRICEMCCRSKDFNLEAAASVSHASSTCV